MMPNQIAIETASWHQPANGEGELTGNQSSK